MDYYGGKELNKDGNAFSVLMKRDSTTSTVNGAKYIKGKLGIRSSEGKEVLWCMCESARAYNACV